jgi:hypothetical protein
VIRISFRRDQQALLKKSQRLTRRDQGGISADGFAFLGPDSFARFMKPVADLIVRELGHFELLAGPSQLAHQPIRYSQYKMANIDPVTSIEPTVIRAQSCVESLTIAFDPRPRVIRA